MKGACAIAVIAVALWGCAAVSAQSPVNTPCHATLYSTGENVKATFDLSSLISTNATGWYAEDDSDKLGDKEDFYYYYNFCQNLQALPTTNPPSQCSNAPGGAAPGNMYQVRYETTTGKDNDCHLISVASNYSWSLVDTLNPARGVVVRYGGGDQCASNIGNGAREVFITVLCKRSGQEPVMGVVGEPGGLTTCDYELTIESPAGCPVECPFNNEVLCSGHGVCGPDNDIHSVRCYCNTGYTGADCSQQAVPDTGSSGGGGHATSVLVAFVIILTIALLAMAVVLYRKIKRLNADDSRYGQLTDADDSSKRRAAAAAHISGAGGATTSAAAMPAAHAQDQGASSQLAAAVSANV